MTSTLSPIDLSPLSTLENPRSGRLILRVLRQFLLSPKVWNYFKGFAIGAALANSVWLRDLLWQRVKGLFFAKAVFRDRQVPYTWVKHYIAQHQLFFKAQDVEVCYTSNSNSRREPDDEDDEDDSEDDEDEDDCETEAGRISSPKSSAVVSDLHGSLPSEVTLFPLDSARFHFVFEGVHVFAVRERQLVGDGEWEETLTLSFLTWRRSIIGKFLRAAKAAYDVNPGRNVRMYSTDTNSNYWTVIKSLPKRSSESVHLPSDVKKTLLDDAGLFLQDESKAWYSERGIPYRRGYLLYGPPGTGKTSLAHVLASEYELPIYQLNLSGRNIDDDHFQRLMGSVASRAIVILEDVDAAFGNRKAGATSNSKCSVSFSCLLNAIDGLGAADSRLLLMTTNHRELLDEALIRPGRTDLQLEFKKADRSQMVQLFKRWFLPANNKKRRSRAVPRASSDSFSALSDESQTPWSDAEVFDQAVAGPFNRLIPSDAELEFNAEAFAHAVPEYTCSIAELQGYLLTCSGKSLRQTVEGVKVWLEQKP